MAKARTLFLILLLAFLLRFQPIHFSGYADPDTYFHERNIETIVSTQQAFFFDIVSQQGRYYTNFPLFHDVFAVFSIITGFSARVLLLFFPALFGVLLSLFVFLFAHRLFGERAALFAAFSLAIMPLSLVRTSGVARPDAMAMLFLLCCFFALFFRKNKTAIFFAVAVAFANPVPSSVVLIAIAFAASLVLKIKKEQDFFIEACVISIASLVVYFLWMQHFPFGFEYYFSPVAANAMELQKTDFAWLVATLKFSWLFFAFGFFVAKKQWFLRTWSVFCVLVGMAMVRLALFLAMPAAIFSGFGLKEFEERTKEYSKVFFAMLFVLAALTVFPEIWNAGNYLRAEEKAGILWLNENAASDANIASQWDFGDPIQGITNRAVVIDGHFEYNPGVGARFNDIVAMIGSGNCRFIQSIVSKYKINYFFSDHETLFVDYGDCGFANRVLDANSARVFSFN